MSAFSVQTQRESSQPSSVWQPGQFETLETYNEAIRAAPNTSDLRWAIVPGTVKHMDRILDSPYLNPPVPRLNASDYPVLSSVPARAWNQNVVGVNNRPLDITWGSLIADNIAGAPRLVYPQNWNVSQPGMPPASSLVSTNYAQL